MITLIVLVGLPLLYYAFVGVKAYTETKNVDDYFIYSRSMGTRDFSETFIATTLSLATELTFFMSFGATAGLSTLWAPITFIVGTVIFIKIIRTFSSYDYGKEFLKKSDTIIDFIKNRTKYYSSNKSTNIFTSLFIFISLLSLISIFIIEMFIVTEVFSIFDIFSTDEGMFGVATIFTCLVLIYVYLGGFKSVIDTDEIQLFLMFIAVSILLGLGIWLYLYYDNYVFNRELLNFSPSNLMGGNLWLGLSFLTAFFAINFYRYISYIGSWQRILAIGDAGKIETGLKATIGGVVIVMVVLTIVGMLFAGVGGDLGSYDATVMISSLVFLLELETLFGNILLGFVLAGLVAALISTADSHIIATTQTISYDLFKLFNKNIKDENIVKVARKIILPLLILSIIFYYIIVYQQEWGFKELLFLFFSLQAVLAVPVLYIMFHRAPSALIAYISLLCGFFFYWYIVLVFPNNDYLLFLNPMLIILIEGTVIFIGNQFQKK